MKKILLLIILASLTIGLFSQAKKPSIMVVPSDTWMETNGYWMEFENQGKTIGVPDYEKAVRNGEVSDVVTAIGTLMQERGFTLLRLDMMLKKLNEQSATDAMRTSESGSEISMSPVDKLKNVAKADIWIYVDWEVLKVGPNKQVKFTLAAIDPYTSSGVASTLPNTGPPSVSASVSQLLVQALLNDIDNFNYSLQSYFDDLFANGRKVYMRVQVWDSSPMKLTDEVNDDLDELRDMIKKWVGQNAVNGRYSVGSSSATAMEFTEIRIPLYDADGIAITLADWAKGLRKYLKSEYKLVTLVDEKGLGSCDFIIGEK